MSIVYKLFGIPMNVDEFGDMIKTKSDEKKVNIKFEEYNSDDYATIESSGNNFYAELQGSIKGKTKRMCFSSHYPEKDDYKFRDMIASRLTAQICTLKEGLDVAEKFENIGLKVTINKTGRKNIIKENLKKIEERVKRYNETQRVNNYEERRILRDISIHLFTKITEDD